ncbi:MAG: Rieske 2Fe-2S domain-containing protein [Planctomycetales bacterium]|nr:Rieske 2Fe-2S domain-containing protein [Planctomycetales bacterium]
MSETKTTPAVSSAETNGGEPRRNFLMSLSATVVGAAVGLIPVFTGLIAFLDPLSRKRKVPGAYAAASGGREGFVKVCSLEALAVDGSPQRFAVIDNQTDAWNFTPAQAVGSVYVQRTGNSDVRVFNTTCPHAGCSVAFTGSAYHCPCHNSAFNLDGTKLQSTTGRENPSPRPLDELVVDADKLADGEVWVKYQNFYTGREEQIPKS